MAPKTKGDSGVTTAPTARGKTFSGGMPAADPTSDDGVNTATAARPDVFNPVGTNPPSADSDPGSA
ncbi:MAG: hypothetical protein ACXVUL_10065 [Solirubrobacteraceae bacterium]